VLSTPQIHLLAAALLAAIAGTSPRMVWLDRAPVTPAAQGVAPGDGVAGLSVTAEACPAGMFLDDGACVMLPQDESWGEDPVGAPEGEARWNGHFDRRGQWQAYEQIPRRPDRTADYDAYQYPIPAGLPGGKYVISGYDLDLPDSMQRRGKTLRAVGHGAVDLPQKRGTPIKMIPLEHQVGDAKVLWVGEFMGQSVITLHTVREGGRDREYVVIFGHIDSAVPGLKRGNVVKLGETIAYVGDTGSPELVHLHLETRRVRDGVDGSSLWPGAVLAPHATIVCDPRNVLPLKQ
jgi:murein DD-endopeptidase MepM/ murein hydrolase activator NlpD